MPPKPDQDPPSYYVAFNPRAGEWGVLLTATGEKVHSWHRLESQAHEAILTKSNECGNKNQGEGT